MSSQEDPRDRPSLWPRFRSIASVYRHSNHHETPGIPERHPDWHFLTGEEVDSGFFACIQPGRVDILKDREVGRRSRPRPRFEAMGNTMMNLRRAGLIALVALLADSRGLLADCRQAERR